MTREEMLVLLKEMKQNTINGTVYNDPKRESKSIALDMAIKALEQEPEHLVKESGDLVKDLVKDAVSRQAVLDKKELVELEDGQSFYCISPEDVETLPSVTPKPKTGHWIKITPSGIYMCSECEQNVLTGDIDVYHYCHHCGIKMIEPQAESEE
jgi:DNA-directed RNA polymerase subunit RPC12/RpoP